MLHIILTYCMLINININIYTCLFVISPLASVNWPSSMGKHLLSKLAMQCNNCTIYNYKLPNNNLCVLL